MDAPNMVLRENFIAIQTYVKKLEKSALAGVAQWIEFQPANQKVPGSIPSRGTCLGCGPGPQ